MTLSTYQKITYCIVIVLVLKYVHYDNMVFGYTNFRYTMKCIIVIVIFCVQYIGLF